MLHYYFCSPGLESGGFLENPRNRRVVSGEVLPLSGLPGFPRRTQLFRPTATRSPFPRGTQESGIYTTLVGGEKPLRLTSDPGRLLPDVVTGWPTGRFFPFL